PAWFSWVGTALALEVLEGFDIAEIAAHNISLANRFLDGAGLEPGNSAIASVNVADGNERLQAAGILGAVRAGNVRLAFHLYNTEADADAALNALYG
ncbi:MAG: aminotransferase, partial [Actinomycetota bacterium]|nr:aminotransferase [Actinomycetota bacterium]